MTTLADQIERIQWLLQDRDTSQTRLSRIILQHQEELTRMTRDGGFPMLTWLQASAGQARYQLPLGTAHVGHVLYNQTVLRFVTEAALDRSRPGWERLTGEPTYWTTDNQPPNIVRVIPPPLRDGSSIPVFPAFPMAMQLVDNLLIFHTVSPADDIANVQDTLPTMADDDDLLVYATVEALAMQETTLQNLPVAQACGQLVALWQSLMKGGPR